MTPVHYGQDRERVRLRRWVLFWLLAFWAMTIQLAFPPAPRLLWNASASAPLGLYRVSPGTLPARGAMVVAWTPESHRRMAAERHYLPQNIPLVKRVAGVAGDRVCAFGDAIRINGRKAVTRLAQDRQGRAMPWWQGCRTLEGGEYLLLMPDASGSFDGRYFGITRAADVIGRASPLWTR